MIEPRVEQHDTPSTGRPFKGRFWMDRPRALFGVGYALAFIITALAIWVVAVAPGSAGEGRAMAARACTWDSTDSRRLPPVSRRGPTDTNPDAAGVADVEA